MPRGDVASGSNTSSASSFGQPLSQPQAAGPVELQGRQPYQVLQPQPPQQEQQQQTLEPHNNHYNFGPSDPNYPGALTDLSALMFPSADPFAYPIPPMTTLEQNAAWGMEPSRSETDRRISSLSNATGSQHGHSGNPGTQDHHMPSPTSADEYNHNSIPASTAATDTVFADDNIDVHLFGPMPGYMMQQSFPSYVGSQQQQQQHSDHMRHYNQENGGMGPHQGGHAHTQQHQPPSHQMWNQGGMGYEDIFGNDAAWRGHM